MSGQDSDSKPQRSGRVRHEPGGKAVWEWAIESGRHALDSTSRLLKKLDLSSLRLVGDDEKAWEKKGLELPPDEASPGSNDPPRTFGSPPEKDPAAGRGFNPYDTRTPTGRGASKPKPPAPPKPRITQPVRPAKKPGFLARLFGRRG
ncbi:MAG TPA: hypothetical protein VNQ32_09430 [Steroidobacteraceae bacterium]|nr:hypothetical protein [Steroidobacteraceae bacterium]